MPGHTEFEFNFKTKAADRQNEAQPFNLLILGNFSGQAASLIGAPADSIAKRRIVALDLDNVDILWSLFAPFLQLQMGTGSIEFSPRDIDDFHPDNLFRTLPVFGKFRDMRQRLLDQDTAQSALDELLSSGAVLEGALLADQIQPSQTGPNEDSGLMFERLLGRPAGKGAAQTGARPEFSKLDTFIRELVAPHIVHEPDPRVETAINSVDLAIAELMRRILHHVDFQALESRWRALFDLVSKLELDENLQLFVCDIRRDELLTGLPEPGSSLQECALLHLLAERRHQAADDSPYSVIVGDYYFGPEAEDIALLTALGAAAAVNGGIFLAGARPALLGCSTMAELADTRNWSSAAGGSELWRALRTSAVADRIGLTLPRVLARLPYGEQTEEIDSFEFEEMPHRNHQDYLWANPAFACARLLAESFTREGWELEPGSHVDLGDLPAHHYREDGESKLQPCAEMLLSEATMVAILDRGLMPLISYRNQNKAVVGRFQSIASPAAALAGPWGR